MTLKEHEDNWRRLRDEANEARRAWEEAAREASPVKIGAVYRRLKTWGFRGEKREERGRVMSILGTSATPRLRILNKNGTESGRWTDMYSHDKWKLVSEPETTDVK